MCVSINIGQDLDSLHHMEQYIAIALSRSMRPPRDLSVQKNLLESDWLEAVVNTLYSNPRHNKNKTEMLCSKGQICWSTTSIVAHQKVL